MCGPMACGSMGCGPMPCGPTGVARAEIADAADQLSTGLRPRAQRLLGVTTAGAAPEVYEELLPPVPLPTRLAPAPETLAELTEEFGALLAAEGEGAVFERTLDGLVRHAHRDREALVEALGTTPARSWWAGRDAASLSRHFGKGPHGLDLVVATLFEQVDTETLRPVRYGTAASSGCAHDGPLWAFDARLREIAYRIRTDPLPFLLSTPTWSTGSLEPTELVARLDAYRRSGARPGEADFAQALLRVRRDDPAALASAAAAARELGTRAGDGWPSGC